MRLAVISVCFVLMLGTVGAHAGENLTLPDAGTTPSSPFFGLERAQETVSLALTFNKQKKAEKRLHMAEERLAEAEKLADRNSSRGMEKALRMHARAMENAERSLNGLPEEKRANLSQQRNNTRGKSLSVLQDLKDRLPESAMKGINTAIQAHRQTADRNQSAQRNRQDAAPETGDRNRSEEQGQNSRPNQSQDRPETSGYTATGRVIRVSS